MAAGLVATSRADCAEELMTNISHTTEKTYHNLERVAFWKHNGVLKPALLQIGLKIYYSTKPLPALKPSLIGKGLGMPPRKSISNLVAGTIFHGRARGGQQFHLAGFGGIRREPTESDGI
jgi:hypothetical protein